MKPRGGWAGRILTVDLAEGRFSTLPTEGFQEYIGGRGINQYLLLRDLPVETAADSPENRLLFGAGPLVGTRACSSSRMNIDCKNVLTGGAGSANVGGHFAAELKFAGYDHIVIHGRAEKPVYLHLRNGVVELRDACHLWGKGVQETASLIRKELNDPGVRVAAIGPAGERRVRFACIIVDEGRAAGYAGCGAVMGIKNLKAIAVRGTQDVVIASPSAFDESVKRMRGKIEASDSIRTMRLGGTHLVAGAGGPKHTNPQGCRNLQDEFWAVERSQKVSEKAFKPFEISRVACFNCPIRCSHLYEIPAGEYKGKRVEGIQSNTVRAFTSNLDVDDPLVLLNANFLVNDLGLDVDGTAVALGWIFECFERGIVTSRDTDGLTLNWGNGDAALSLIKKIAFREGVGALLAEGVARASREVGRGSEAFAMHVKGGPLNESCVRSHKAWALGIMTSSRGSGHLRGAPNTEQKAIPPDVSQRLWRIPDAGIPRSYRGKGKLVTWFESYKAVVDSLGLCSFTTYWRDVDLVSPKDLADLFCAATGREVDEVELLRMGERIQNIEKVFNTVHGGFRREDDNPPNRLMESPVSSGPFEGERLDREEWATMLNEYYDAHQWNRKTGWQTEACLEELQLPEFVRDLLEKNGKLSRP